MIRQSVINNIIVFQKQSLHLHISSIRCLHRTPSHAQFRILDRRRKPSPRYLFSSLRRYSRLLTVVAHHLARRLWFVLRNRANA